jgi:hypothetical protein
LAGCLDIAEATVAFRFNDRVIKSVADLLLYLKEDEEQLSQAIGEGGQAPTRWFRGLEDMAYQLIPTFHWKGFKIEDEIYMMNLFKQNSHEFLGQIPTSEWEWMFLMRHHGLPSRLLDWSENPLIGLFFAVCPDPLDKQAEADGVLWCLLPTRLDEWSLGWPQASKALPMFTENEAEYSLAENDALLNYLPSRMHQPLAAQPVAKPPAAGISVRTTRRMQAQRGVFTVHHSGKTPLEQVEDMSHIWRYTVPAKQKEQVRQELERVGITRLAVFPDLDNVADEASESVGGH